MSSNTQDLVLAYINDYVSRNEELSKLKKALSKFLAGKELPKFLNSWNPLLMKWKIKKRKANQETHHLIVKTLHLRVKAPLRTAKAPPQIATAFLRQ